jgi:hypothetical protein
MPEGEWEWGAMNPKMFPHPEKERKTAWEEFQELYPIGALVKTLIKVQDPLKKGELPSGSFVTIKDVVHSNSRSNKLCIFSKAWILCEDQNKELWNVRPHYLEKYKAPTGKRGRFRILSQDAEMEKQNKETLCQKK